MAAKRNAKRAKYLADAMDHILEARFALLMKRAAEERGDHTSAARFGREAHSHLQAAKRLLRQADAVGKR